MAASSLPPLACGGVSLLSQGYTHKQKEQRNMKEKRRLHPVEAQTKTQTRKMVLKHGVAPLVAESRFGRPECTRVAACAHAKIKGSQHRTPRENIGLY